MVILSVFALQEPGSPVCLVEHMYLLHEKYTAHMRYDQVNDKHDSVQSCFIVQLARGLVECISYACTYYVLSREASCLC